METVKEENGVGQEIETVIDSPAPQKKKTPKKNKTSFGTRLKQGIPYYLMVLPAFLVVLFMKYLPMFGVVLAFKDYDGRLVFDSPWADYGGFGNFVEIFSIKTFVDSIPSTILLSVLSICITFPAPILLALLMNELKNKAFKKTVQTISFIPHFLSWAAITGIINQLFGEYGFLDSLFPNYEVIWSRESSFIPTYLITTLWQSVGWGTILYLSTLVGISPDLYEAAQIDGANRWQQTWKITLPALIPTAMIQLIIMSGTILGSNFELIYGLRKQHWQMNVISTVVYEHGIGSGEYGLSTALSLFQSGISLILTMVVNAIAKKVSKVSMW